ncbi:MAG TPA: HDIG domain-containing metalloprotein [bacterium]
MRAKTSFLLNQALRSIREACSLLKAEAYIVGGFLRDRALGRDCQDLDILVMNVDPGKIAEFLHKRAGFHSPVLFRRFGTYRVGRDGIDVEIVPPRGGTLEKDLQHRDFTINTLLSRILASSTGRAVDLLGAAFRDLEMGVIRTPIAPQISIKEDPLRMIRAIRFEQVLGFKMDKTLRRAIKEQHVLINDVSKERVREELEKILLGKKPSISFRRMHDALLLSDILPELDETCGFDQRSPYHHEDLFNHTLSSLDSAPPNLEIRLAALFHDIGKKDAQKQINGKFVHYGHQDISAVKARNALKRLRFPKRVIEPVVFLVQHHMVQYSSLWGDSAVKRFIRKMGGKLDDMLALLEADWGSLRHNENFKMFEDLQKRISKFKVEEINRVESPLNGHEIQKILKIPPGPAVGRAKDAIVDAILENKIRPSNVDALRFLRKNRTSILKNCAKNY